MGWGGPCAAARVIETGVLSLYSKPGGRYLVKKREMFALEMAGCVAVCVCVCMCIYIYTHTHIYMIYIYNNIKV